MTRPSGTHPAEAPGTRSDWAERQLRELIISGELAPNEKLTGAALSARLSLSPTPLREALQRLSNEGLVIMEAQRGARVAPVSLRDAEEIYDLRVTLEPRALRESMLCYDSGYRRTVHSAYGRFLSAHGDRHAHSYQALDAHRQFHSVLLARCPSRWLLRIVTSLADHSMRYQALAMGGFPTIESHEELLDVVLAGKADEAAALLERHLRGTLTIVEAEVHAHAVDPAVHTV